MTDSFLDHNTVIAAVKDEKGLEAACRSGVKIVFLLFGNISDIAGYTETLKKSGKQVFIHIDLISGLMADREGLRYIANTVKPNGIISTKPNSIKQAAELGLKGVFRIFMIDAAAYETGLRGVKICRPTYVEVMPGLVYEAIHELHAEITTPIIAGGMIRTKEQSMHAIKNGAVAISTSNRLLWE